MLRPGLVGLYNGIVDLNVARGFAKLQASDIPSKAPRRENAFVLSVGHVTLCLTCLAKKMRTLTQAVYGQGLDLPDIQPQPQSSTHAWSHQVLQGPLHGLLKRAENLQRKARRSEHITWKLQQPSRIMLHQTSVDHIAQSWGYRSQSRSRVQHQAKLQDV